jgi:glycosyltransferase involved in cell wall biosynthesis
MLDRPCSAARRQAEGMVRLEERPRPPTPRDAFVVAPSAGGHPTAPRILHVATRYLRGGSEKRIRDMVHALPEAEHHVAVGGGSDLELARRELDEATVLLLPSLVREVDPVRDLPTILRMVRLIRRLDADLVITHQSKAGVIGRAAAWAAARPVVHSLSMASFGPGYPAWQDRAFRVIERRLAGVTSRFVASGDDLRRRFAALGVPAGKLRVVRSGLALPERDPTPVPARTATIAYVGSLDERKNVRSLVPLLQAVAARIGPDVRLHVAGEGPSRGALEDDVRAARLEDRVRVLGYVADPYTVIREASVIVLLSSAEGLPQVLVQAAAIGTPFVSYAVDGARELLELGARGAVVPIGDLANAARAVAALVRGSERGAPIDLGPWRRERILADHRAVLLEALAHAREAVPA